MTKDQLTDEIRNAFSDEPYPGDLHIVFDNSGYDLECEEIRESFKGKSWDSLSNDFLFEQRYSSSFFSHEGFKYYLPAFLIFAAGNFHDADDLPDNIILKLTLPTEIDVAVMANAIKKYKIDEQMPNLDFDAILQNQLEHKNRDVHNFIARFNRFTSEQGRVVKHFLDFMRDEHKDDFLHDEPAVAIERYWFQFD